MIGNLPGPYKGRRYDSFILAESSSLAHLQQHAWFRNYGLSIFEGPAYPLSIHLQAPFRGAHLTDERKRYNKAVSSVRVSVEWLFGLVKNYFKFIEFKQMQRTGMCPVGKVYFVCALLQNVYLIWSCQTPGITFSEKNVV